VARWLPELELVDLTLGQVIYESGGSLSDVYFTVSAIVSLLYVMEDAHRPRSRSWATRG